ncbi:MAG: alpha/beta family hydrolase [Myxococcota bacterium]
MSDASPQFEEVKIPLPDRLHDLDAVPGLLGVPEWWPTGSRVAVVIARANADEDPLIDGLQQELTAKKVLTLSFPMPYMVAGKRNPDDMRQLKRVYQSAVTLLGRDPSAAPAHIFIGGKNAGALVAAHAATTRMRVEGLFLLGFPLHKQDDPSEPRTEQLYRAITPMLFVQGRRDRHCDLPTLRNALGRVGAPVSLHVVEDADHQLRVPKKSGRTPEEVRAEVLAALEVWMKKTLGSAT